MMAVMLEAMRKTCLISLLPVLGTALLLSGCVVPLKKTPVGTNPSSTQPQFNFGELAVFAVAAGHAYDAEADIKASYGAENVLVQPLPVSDGQYFIVVSTTDMTQLISIRGTANKNNAYVDINSIKIKDPVLDIYVHRGFKAATDELYADALPHLRKDYKTRITGHSLGGAMACLFMMRLLQDGFIVDKAVTFGQPKVTNAAGGEKFKTAPLLRIMNDQDIVPQLPPSNIVYDLSGPYEHFGPEINLTAGNKYTYSLTNQPKDLVTGGNWKNIKLEDAVDHQIKAYIDKIEALKGQ